MKLHRIIFQAELAVSKHRLKIDRFNEFHHSMQPHIKLVLKPALIASKNSDSISISKAFI